MAACEELSYVGMEAAISAVLSKIPQVDFLKDVLVPDLTALT